ncbi:MAG TPA: HD domain-containing phosphohydrolase [Gemmatimonadaceae bacterium]|nr:HD domain-containing phosphohydrolase [Gemmatimonadaceae bacterium]
MLLAIYRLMLRYVPFIVGAAAGAVIMQKRKRMMGLERLSAATLETLLDAIDANSPETGAHVRRVADYALRLAAAADLDEASCKSIERVALFHDIGKLDEALSDIVKDTATLTPRERRAIMTHPRRGAQVLAPLGAFYPDLPEGVLSHHERWDGTGYPRHLKGERIPIAARVVAIADTFDAITHSRSYSDGRSTADAAEVLASGRATQFDPELVDLFLSPPVLSDVKKSMTRFRKPKDSPSRRNRGDEMHKAPDVSFRWRTTKLAPRRQDP